MHQKLLELFEPIAYKTTAFCFCNLQLAMHRLADTLLHYKLNTYICPSGEKPTTSHEFDPQGSTLCFATYLAP